MGIPEGTVLARAKREGWTRQIESSKALAKRDDGPFGVTTVEAVTASQPIITRTNASDHWPVTRSSTVPRAHRARVRFFSGPQIKSEQIGILVKQQCKRDALPALLIPWVG